MLPVELDKLFTQEIAKGQRAPDGMLHASGDLNGSLRHTMLRLAGAPTKGRSIASDIRLQHGTLWHEWFHSVLIRNGVPFFHELNLTPYMPPGWSGTADWIFWHPDYRAFVLGDLKTAKGEAMYWIGRDGAKAEHIWQLSAYFYALVEMGLPMVKGFSILYWPMNDVADSEILPSVQECEPLPEDVIKGRMNERWAQSSAYLDSLPAAGPQGMAKFQGYDAWLTDALAPVQDRVQKVTWNKKQAVFDVKLHNHWSAAFCEYDTELCDCSTHGTTKIGHYTLEGEYVPRKDYESEVPVVMPTTWDYTKRKKEADGRDDAEGIVVSSA